VAIGRFEMDTVLMAIERYRCTSTTLIATLNAAIVNCGKAAGYDLSSLRACFSGGAPVPSALAERWEQSTGFKLMEGYGLSETTAPTHINPPHRPKYGSVGLALPLTDVKLVSLEDGRTEVGPGEAGEVAVKGPMVMKGYWCRPRETAEVMHEGWLLTGDIGRFDDEGYLHIEERKKDLIKASGYSVYPAEVEAAMFRHPVVAEVGVVGVPDPYRGEDVVAFVVPRKDAAVPAEAELVEWCRAEMAVYKAPRRVVFLEALPRTASGKILRRALREHPAVKPPA
jgi:acyl-CoA synthetase (AMP-forming)/AMP-acid ligase II